MSQKHQLLPSEGGETQDPTQALPRGLSCPCWYVLHALPYLGTLPSFVRHGVLSAFMDEEIEAQRGLWLCPFIIADSGAGHRLRFRRPLFWTRI